MSIHSITHNLETVNFRRGTHGAVHSRLRRPKDLPLLASQNPSSRFAPERDRDDVPFVGSEVERARAFSCSDETSRDGSEKSVRVSDAARFAVKNSFTRVLLVTFRCLRPGNSRIEPIPRIAQSSEFFSFVPADI